MLQVVTSVSCGILLDGSRIMARELQNFRYLCRNLGFFSFVTPQISKTTLISIYAYLWFNHQKSFSCNSTKHLVTIFLFIENPIQIHSSSAGNHHHQLLNLKTKLTPSTSFTPNQILLAYISYSIHPTPSHCFEFICLGSFSLASISLVPPASLQGSTKN